MSAAATRPEAAEALARLEACQLSLEGGRTVSHQDGLVSEVLEGGARSRYAYLPGGDLASITEPDGTVLAYRYGDDGRLLAVTRNGSPWAEYRYDGAGRLVEVRRADGQRTHQHDDRGRLVRTLRGDASAFSYAYDAQGRVALARCDLEETRFGYDALGRPARLEQTVQGQTVTVERELDERGRLRSLRFAPWGLSCGYRWDERGRPLALVWQGRTVATFGYDDGQRRAFRETADRLREDTWHDAVDGRPCRRRLARDQEVLRDEALAYGAERRLEREGGRTYHYDDLGRLAGAADEGGREWRFLYDAMDDLLPEGGGGPGAGASALQVDLDAAGRTCRVRRGAHERVFQHNQAGELVAVLEDGRRVARLGYDHKGRLVLKRTGAGEERYVYGPDDALIAVADGAGAPLLVFLRLPTGLQAVVDLRGGGDGEVVFLHGDGRGTVRYAGVAGGALEGPFGCDPFGLPEAAPGTIPSRVPMVFKERTYHADLGLYFVGCRWYDPSLRRFLTPDSYTGAPDDERLVNPLQPAGAQRMARAQILSDWLKQPRVRNRFAYCCNDPVNRFDPNGHWSFGGVLLSILGAIWTLPNTLFGLVVEITCLVGEVIRWLVWLFSGGNVSWATPGIDAASSGRLNAFALVFRGGWLGSFESLLGITFGNVFFTNKTWETHPAYLALPAQVSPPAYAGQNPPVTIPKEQALYEHELRHVNQYSWFGPFFHLGLPLFGVYEWDVIFNGYQNAWTERDAREHGGF
jgi:RHS repeat-associated protein